MCEYFRLSKIWQGMFRFPARNWESGNMDFKDVRCSERRPDNANNNERQRRSEKANFCPDEFSDKTKKNFLDGYHAFFVIFRTEIITCPTIIAEDNIVVCVGITICCECDVNNSAIFFVEDYGYLHALI